MVNEIFRDDYERIVQNLTEIKNSKVGSWSCIASRCSKTYRWERQPQIRNKNNTSREHFYLENCAKISHSIKFAYVIFLNFAALSLCLTFKYNFFRCTQVVNYHIKYFTSSLLINWYNKLKYKHHNIFFANRFHSVNT